MIKKSDYDRLLASASSDLTSKTPETFEHQDEREAVLDEIMRRSLLSMDQQKRRGEYIKQERDLARLLLKQTEKKSEQDLL